MMGISIDGPLFVFGDNQCVLSNTSFTHLTLNYESLIIESQFGCEGVINNEWLTTYLNTNLNSSYMLKKSLPGGDK